MESNAVIVDVSETPGRVIIRFDGETNSVVAELPPTMFGKNLLPMA